MIDSVIAMSFTASPRLASAAPRAPAGCQPKFNEFSAPDIDVLHGALPCAPYLPSGVSIAQCSTIAARIGPTLEEPVFAIDADCLRVPKIVVPIGDHLNRLSSPFQ